MSVMPVPVSLKSYSIAFEMLVTTANVDLDTGSTRDVSGAKAVPTGLEESSCTIVSEVQRTVEHLTNCFEPI